MTLIEILRLLFGLGFGFFAVWLYGLNPALVVFYLAWSHFDLAYRVTQERRRQRES